MVAASGCAPPMPPRPAVRIQLPGEVAAVMLAADLDEGLVGALHDALAADVDPRAGRHLAVHHQALAIELVEVLPGRPVRHEVGVGDQHARRVGDGCGRRRPACPTGPAASRRRSSALQRGDDAVEALPVARRAADAAIDDELAGLLGDLGIEVVHQHAQRRFGQPALGRERRAARRADDCGRCRCGSWRSSSGAQKMRAVAIAGPAAAIDRAPTADRARASRACDVGMRGSGPRRDAAPRARSSARTRFERRARSQRRVEVAALRRGQQLDRRRSCAAFSAIGEQPARAVRRHRDVVLLVGRGRDANRRWPDGRAACSRTPAPPPSPAGS